MAKEGVSVKQAAEVLGVTPKWVRGRIAASAIAPKRAGGRHRGPYAITDADLDVLRALIASKPTNARDDTLARIGKLEAERANLLARLAWERATAEAHQKALDDEKRRVEILTAEVAAQRTRVEQLKALTVWDRMLGRHKDV